MLVAVMLTSMAVVREREIGTLEQILSTALGIGLLISTVSRTQQQAMMTVFLYFMPAVLFSGFLKTLS